LKIGSVPRRRGQASVIGGIIFLATALNILLLINTTGLNSITSLENQIAANNLVNQKLKETSILVLRQSNGNGGPVLVINVGSQTAILKSMFTLSSGSVKSLTPLNIILPPGSSYNLGPAPANGQLGVLTAAGNVFLQEIGSFSLSANPSTISVNPGSSAVIQVTVTPSKGYNLPVTLYIQNAPPGVGVQYFPQTVSPTSAQPTSSLLLSVQQSAPPVNSYAMSICGSGSDGKTSCTSVSITT
jgi:hypothetical protein